MDIDFDLDLTRASRDVLVAQRQALLAALQSPADDADVERLAARAQEVADAIEKHNQRVAAADQARRALMAGNVSHTSTGAERSDDADDGQRTRQPVSLGRAFTQSQEFRAYGGSGQSPKVEVPGAVRALFATTDFPSQPERVPGVMTPDRDAPLPILDLIDRQTTGSNVVEWVKEDTHNLNAAEVAEGQPKQESDWAVSLETSVVQTIAHWVNITRQALSDEQQIEGYVNGRLTYGLLRRANQQVLNGDGTSPNLRGILNTSGIGTYASPAGEDPLISVRKARTVAELSEYVPDAVVVHPTNWETIELSADDSGRFRAAVSVGEGAAARLWGLSVIPTVNIAAGTFLVGGFREGATLWEREGVTIYITDSHASNFTSNILTLLAEMRAALSVWRPKAFVRGTITPAAAA